MLVALVRGQHHIAHVLDQLVQAGYDQEKIKAVTADVRARTETMKQALEDAISGVPH